MDLSLEDQNKCFENFKSWKSLVENQISKMVKRFRTDNGLELCSKLYNTFCKENGIARH